MTTASPQSATARDIAALPARDRIPILIGLAGAVVLAWAELIRMALAMEGMSEGGMPGMASMGAMAMHAWTAADFAFMFWMWAVMMVGMMLPSATPMTLMYAAVSRKAERQGTPVAPTAVFVAGYITVWTLFSLTATAAQWGLDRAALLSSMMVSNSPLLGAVLLIAAGLYQWTPYKDSCLQHCRAPAQFMSQNWQAGAGGAWSMGIVHGGYCLGCCWALMALLFVGGVMNLFWIALIALFVLAEKALPAGSGGARWSGTALILAGLVFAGLWLRGA